MKTIRTRTDLAWLMAQADTQQVDSMQTVLLVGPPGSCKTMVARRMARRVPHLEGRDHTEVAWLHYGAGLGTDYQLTVRAPFRAPHHTCSAESLAGGKRAWLDTGTWHAYPGEASLAHRGTLFLDELPEFGRHVVRDLGCIMAHGASTVDTQCLAHLPARPRLLIAAADPCPCGHQDPRSCACSQAAIATHDARVREYAELLGIAVYVRLDLDDDAKRALTEDYPV